MRSKNMEIGVTIQKFVNTFLSNNVVRHLCAK